MLSRERIHELIGDAEERLRTVAPKLPDHDGNRTSFIADEHQRLALATYIDVGDAVAFRRHLQQSIVLRIQLTKRLGDGEPIEPRWVNSALGVRFLTACASGSIALAVEWASLFPASAELMKPKLPIPAPTPSRRKMVRQPKAIDDYNNAFDRCVRALLLNQRTELQVAIADASAADGKLKNECRDYINTIVSVAERDESLFAESMAVQNKEHVVFARRGQLRSDLEAWVSLKGVGWTNLARHFGMNVQPSPPLIPADLVIPVNLENRVCP